MPCWGMHLHIAKKVNKRLNLEENLFLIGNVLPDIYSGYIIKNASKIEKYEISHFGERTLLGGKKYTLPNIEKFEKENELFFRENILLLGYFSHILTDYFFNKYSFEKIYVKDENSNTIGCYLKNGEFYKTDGMEVRSFKHSDFSRFSNKKLENFKNKLIELTPEIIGMSKKINTMEIYEEDLIKTVEYINDMILYKCEKNNKIKFDDYKIYTEEILQKITDDCIDFVYNRIKNYKK